MRFRLRTLLILLAVMPPIMGWWAWPVFRTHYNAWRNQNVVKINRELFIDWSRIRDDQTPATEYSGLIKIIVPSETESSDNNRPELPE
jgi:hypothetical protein